MKSKINKGAKCRAGSAAGCRRWNELENVELSCGYAVMTGRKRVDDSGQLCGVYLKPDGSGETYAPYDCVITDYVKAVELWCEVSRKIESDTVFPPPEFPRIVHVSVSASVVGVA